jgi:hypothetical protein
MHGRTERLRRLFAAAAACLLLGSAGARADSYEDALVAARGGASRDLAQLLERGIDPDTVDAQGNTLLILAAREGHADAVTTLLRYRPGVSRRNPAGDSALMLAALKGHGEIVERLLAAGAEVNHEGWSPLLYAAFEGHVAIIERLLARGANVNALAPNQSNALMLAARNGHTEAVRRLLRTEVNLAQQNDAGLTAESWAQAKGNTDIAALIRAERERRAAGPARRGEAR